MPATLSKIQNADDLTMFLKAKTHMSSEALEMISEVGKQRMLIEIIATAPILIGFPFILMYSIYRSQKKLCCCDPEYHKKY